MEQLGTFTTVGLACLIGGALGLVYQITLTLRTGRPFPSFSPRLGIVCGIPFILYMLFLYLAIGAASSRQQVIEVGLINYLWPILTIVFSIPILKNRARFWLIPGILLALAGIALACLTNQGAGYSVRDSLTTLQHHPLPHLFALAAAMLWGVYSNLAKRHANLSTPLAVPLYLVAAGLVLQSLASAFHEHPIWSAGSVVQLLVLAIVPGALAYILWDVAMRRGNMILVTAFAYLTPLFSTLLMGLYLGVSLTPAIGCACALVIAGAILCHCSMIAPNPNNLEREVLA